MLLSTTAIQGVLQSGGTKPQAENLTQHVGRAGGTQGLGEMMPEQLWATTMDPSSRTLKRLTVADAAEASDVFSLLMGHQVPPAPPPSPPGSAPCAPLPIFSLTLCPRYPATRDGCPAVHAP